MPDEGASAPSGQRRPHDDDLQPVLEHIWEGLSLRKACAKLGLHVPSTSDWLHEDAGRREQYARAREGRAEYIAEDAQDMARAAALGQEHDSHKIADVGGVRAYLDAAKWNTARMAPKTAPATKIDLTSRTRALTDDELAAEIAAAEAADEDEV